MSLPPRNIIPSSSVPPSLLPAWASDHPGVHGWWPNKEGRGAPGDERRWTTDQMAGETEADCRQRRSQTTTSMHVELHAEQRDLLLRAGQLSAFSIYQLFDSVLPFYYVIYLLQKFIHHEIVASLKYVENTIPVTWPIITQQRYFVLINYCFVYSYFNFCFYFSTLFNKLCMYIWFIVRYRTKFREPCRPRCRTYRLAYFPYDFQLYKFYFDWLNETQKQVSYSYPQHRIEGLCRSLHSEAPLFVSV